jgi:hypothetical protein
VLLRDDFPLCEGSGMTRFVPDFLVTRDGFGITSCPVCGKFCRGELRDRWGDSVQVVVPQHNPKRRTVTVVPKKEYL